MEEPIESRAEAAMIAPNPELIKADERRSEPRIETSTSVVMTPLAAVTTRIHGSVVDVSARGVRVHFDKDLKNLPRTGEVYRVQSRDDIMLCEVRHAQAADAGADLGLKIVHWGDAGELKRLVQKHAVGKSAVA
jgi:hypothetical protein